MAQGPINFYVSIDLGTSSVEVQLASSMKFVVTLEAPSWV